MIKGLVLIKTKTNYQARDMPKPDVDEVTLIATQELPPAVSPDRTWKVILAPPTGLFSYQSDIETFGNIISEQIGSAVNKPDRVYQPGVLMPEGSSIENDEDPESPTFGQPVILVDPYLDGEEYSVHLRGVEYLVKGDELSLIHI